MKNSSVTAKTLMVCALSAAVAGFAASAQADNHMKDKEKCYGVSKAGKNDCASASVSCAGHATKDGEGFLVVPKGLCDRIIGGTTTAPDTAK